jgi:hypothetical protein
MKVKLIKVGINEDGNELLGWGSANVSTPAPGSENERPVLVPDTMKPLDIESLPLEQQAIAQVLADEAEKAEKAGIEEPTIDLTRAKVKAKLKELKKQKRQQKQILKAKHTRH